MISLAELSKKNPLFNDDLYISVSELIEVITNHSDGNEDEVITYLVQGLDADPILVHQKTITIGYHDINHDFIVFLTDDELEPLKFTELSNKFDLSNHYLPKNELAKVRNIERLNIELLSDFNCDDLPNSINLEGDNDSEILNKKLSDAEDTILKLKAEIATLEDGYRKLESEKYNNNTRNQDYKIIAMMAILLSEKYPKFKHGENPNRSAIKRDIRTLINELQIDHAHTYGLMAPEQRIKECLEEYLKFFFTVPDSKNQNVD